jgi:hypothetical protein
VIAGALRYDSCFAIASVIGLLLLRRRFALAISTGLAGAISPVIYAVFSYRLAGVTLPFSVIMKSAGALSANPGSRLMASDAWPVLLLLCVAFALSIGRSTERVTQTSFWSYTRSFLVLALITTALHATMGPTGWLLRYDGYIYALGGLALALAVGGNTNCPTTREPPGARHRQVWLQMAFLIALLPTAVQLLHRIHHGWSDVDASIRDRYVEHLPQALFVREEMPEAVVVANDIGFLAYYARSAKILDPQGLGSIEPVRLMLQHASMSPNFMSAWATREGAQLAIIHTDFPGAQVMIPRGWILVESWCFPHNVVYQNHVESFYSPNAKSADSLRERMADFNALAPEIVRYRFPEDGQMPPAPTRGVSAECPIV